MNILTNVVALETKNALKATQSSIATSIRRLSTGLRINSVQDDPAGLAISSRMQSQLSGLNQAKANTSQGISMLQTADDGLAVEAANGTNSATDFASIQAQITELQANIQQIATTTQYNGINLLDGSLSNVQFQMGANAGQTISFGIGSAQQKDLGNNIVSLTGGTGNTAGASITEARAAVSATVAAAVNNVQAQTLTIQGNSSTKTIAVAAGDSVNPLRQRLTR